VRVLWRILYLQPLIKSSIKSQPSITKLNSFLKEKILTTFLKTDSGHVWFLSLNNFLLNLNNFHYLSFSTYLVSLACIFASLSSIFSSTFHGIPSASLTLVQPSVPPLKKPLKSSSIHLKSSSILLAFRLQYLVKQVQIIKQSSLFRF